MPRSLAFLLLLGAAACGRGGGDGADPADPADPAGISIASPEDGATVPGTFPVTMQADGFTIEPAGEVADGAGHFHLVVDADCLPAGEPIPADETHIHLADGANETELTLPAGEHTLCLQAGDGQHAALALTQEITSRSPAGGRRQLRRRRRSRTGRARTRARWSGTAARPEPTAERSQRTC